MIWKLYLGLALILGGAAVVFLTNSTLFRDGTAVQGGRVVDVNFGLPTWLAPNAQKMVGSAVDKAGVEVKVMSCEALKAIVTDDYRHKSTDAVMTTQEHSEMHRAYNRCFADSTYVPAPMTSTEAGSNSTEVKPFMCSGKKLCVTEVLQTIADADTLYTNEHKIRLSLANSPEKGRDGYKEATAFTISLCPIGSEIRIDQDDYVLGSTGSSITGKVFCGEKLLNAELLYNNHAIIMKQYCNQSEFSNEQWARDFGC